MVLTKRKPGEPSPAALRFFIRLVLPVMRVLHRPTLRGEEHLPPEPYLLVGNHPSSIGLGEFASFTALFAERFRGQRRLAGFVHRLFFGIWPTHWLFAQIGAIPSTYEAAEGALDDGSAVVAFPGGDHEAFRPVWVGNRVDLAGRLGVLRIAKKKWLPVVPLGFHGVATPMLLRSRALAWLFVWPRITGVKRFGLSALGVLGAVCILIFVPLAWPWRALIAYAFAISPLALLPLLPVTVRIRIGAPLAPESLFGTRDADDDVLRAALVKVEAAIQAQIDTP